MTEENTALTLRLFHRIR